MDTMRIEVNASAADVARARQFVTGMLEGAGLTELAPEAGLCAGELVTNAVLHGSAPITVAARLEPAGVRLEVTDGSTRSALAGRTLPGERPESMTGRGLMIVGMLAERCGEDLRPDGKTVWCELAWPRADHAEAGGGDPWPAAPPGPGRADAVRIAGLPGRLTVGLERRLGDLVRELRLSSDRPVLAGRLAAAVAEAARRHRHTDNVLGRALRLDPDSDRVDLELLAADLSALEDLGDLVDSTAALCRRGALLTLPPTAAQRELLAWCTQELRRRLEGAAPSPCPVTDGGDELVGLGSPLEPTRVGPRRRGLLSARGARGSEELRVVVAERNVLRSLADAARAMAGARDVETLLRVATEAAQSLVGAHQAVTHRLFGGWDDAVAFVSLSDRYSGTAEAAVLRAGELGRLVAASHRPLRLSAAQVRQHPAMAGLAEHGGEPPWADYLAAPIISRDGSNIGVIQLAEKVDGTPFDDDDEAVVVQLAYMASAAIEHVELLEGYAATMTRLDLALDASQLGIWTWDMATGAVTWSPTMERLYGFAPGAFPGTFEAYSERIHPEDRAATLQRIRLAASRLTRFEYAHRVRRVDGQVRWLQGVGVPVAGPDGAALTMTGVCGDVTDERELQEGLRREHSLVETLQQVGKAVTANLDVDEVAQVVADASVALTPAQWGAFVYDLADPGSTPERRVAVATPHGELPPQFRAVLGRAPLEALGVADDTMVVDDRARAGAPPVPALADGTEGIRSWLAVPIRLGDGEVCGGLVFGHARAGAFSADDARLVEGIASYAAIAVQNGRLYEQARRELENGRRMLAERDHIARTLQQSLLPPRLPAIPGVELASVYQPSGLGNEVGGDFYDVFQMTRREWAVVVGDVCGKGPEAAAVTAAARHTVRAVARVERQPSAVLRRLNDALVEYGASDRFCTVCFVRLVPIVHGVRLSVCCGGHAPPLVVRAGGEVEAVGAPGGLLGVFDQVRLWEETVQLGRGDAVVCFTDGITEARRDGELLGEDRVRATLAGLAGADATALAQGLVDAAGAWTGGPQRDDIAVVVLRIPA